MMNQTLRIALALAGMTMATQATAQITFYENESFQGRSFTASRQVSDFERAGFNDRASSVLVEYDRWEVCEDARFEGRCIVLRPGRYASLRDMGLNDRISSVRMVSQSAQVEPRRYAPEPMPAQAMAQITFYENESFQGRSFTASQKVSDFDRYGFNDRASSVLVERNRWEVCEDAYFEGRCIVLRPGRYASLRDMGLNDRISSVRMVGQSAQVEPRRYAPEPMPVYDSRRRHGEKIYEANVTSVREVVGSSGEHCWVEREQTSSNGGANVPGAIVGALIGGVLGHQVGNGRGNAVATAGGAVAGGVIGSNVGRDSHPGYGQDVQRCSTNSSEAHPAYWDVTYDFRGTEHRVQLTSPPGPTVTVNDDGEPRA